MLALRDVIKTYGGRRVLDGVTLEVGHGARVALIGPSGCGESTALRLFTGLIRPDAGVVEVGGATLTARTLAAARRRLGYVIQDGGLFPHLTARDNVGLGARHHGWDRPRIAARVAELATLVRLPAELLARYPVQLSGGQRQRVALMRALMLDPEVLLRAPPDPRVTHQPRSRRRNATRPAAAKATATATRPISGATLQLDHPTVSEPIPTVLGELTPLT